MPCNINTALPQRLWFLDGVMLVLQLNEVSMSTRQDISCGNPLADSHCSPFSHELTVEVQLTTNI